MRTMWLATAMAFGFLNTAFADDSARIAEADRQEIERVTAALRAGAADLSAVSDAVLIGRAKSAASADLKDPDSAKFRGLQAHHDGNARYVCGEINAKNSYGAYVGYRRFLTDGAAFVVTDGESGKYVFFLLAASSAFTEERAEAVPNPAITAYCSVK